jgi:hypothetical protein
VCAVAGMAAAAKTVVPTEAADLSHIIIKNRKVLAARFDSTSIFMLLDGGQEGEEEGEVEMSIDAAAVDGVNGYFLNSSAKEVSMALGPIIKEIVSETGLKNVHIAALVDVPNSQRISSACECPFLF